MEVKYKAIKSRFIGQFKEIKMCRFKSRFETNQWSCVSDSQILQLVVIN